MDKPELKIVVNKKHQSTKSAVLITTIEDSAKENVNYVPLNRIIAFEDNELIQIKVLIFFICRRNLVTRNINSIWFFCV